jgi:hypothetical protein
MSLIRKANDRISAPDHYWQRTALKTLSKEYIRDSKLLPFALPDPYQAKSKTK